ncbi:MAG: alpha/beta hydrolase, partial [Bacteroidales bacterium]|nr:alpha/beta hydrolase [Bacteroidales bacterium]
AGEEPEGLYEPYKIVPLIPPETIEGMSCKEVVYKTYPDRELRLCIAPAEGAKAPTPVVCFIHGGGWRAGGPEKFTKSAMYVARNAGLAGVSIAYSLIGQEGADISVTMQDLHDAVQYLREHASEYNLDMTRLAFVGHSAGGHLAAMMGLTEPDAKVISAWSGVYDLKPQLAYWSEGRDPDVLKYMLGGKNRKLRPYSPVYIIPKKRQIAVQLFQGTVDTSVHYSQAKTFRDALVKSGQKAVECNIYQYYAHSLNTSSDKGRECFAKFIRFVTDHIYD